MKQWWLAIITFCGSRFVGSFDTFLGRRAHPTWLSIFLENPQPGCEASLLDVALVGIHFHCRHTVGKLSTAIKTPKLLRGQIENSSCTIGISNVLPWTRRYSSSFRASFSWKVRTSVHLTWAFCLSAQYHTITHPPVTTALPWICCGFERSTIQVLYCFEDLLMGPRLPALEDDDSAWSYLESYPDRF